MIQAGACRREVRIPDRLRVAVSDIEIKTRTVTGSRYEVVACEAARVGLVKPEKAASILADECGQAAIADIVDPRAGRHWLSDAVGAGGVVEVSKSLHGIFSPK
jgi:hypothetical protein